MPSPLSQRLDALRAAARDIPNRPGVYIFHGEDEGLPLYIGKSVTLRSRVLAHLRNPSERRLLRRALRVSWERTAGEVGALLLEARLIKERYPLLNKRLRRKGRLCALRLTASGRPEVVYAQEVDFARTPELYGLFPTRSAAIAKLEEIADADRLCHGLLGLERLPKGRPCFRTLVRKCLGACRGAESPAEHASRLRAALSVHALRCWSWPGAVALAEEDGELRQFHVVRNWCYLGTADSIEAARLLDRVEASFDADTYKILCRPLLEPGRALPLP
ncbi:MAG: endonuclease of nucleotide excision repair [Pseudomonadota bacterium]